MMGEIDTKPIEPVHVALSLFGDEADATKHSSTSSHLEDEKEKNLEAILKDLANHKLQLEAKDSAYKEALLSLEYNQTMNEQLSTLLNQSEVEREKYKEEYTRATTHVHELQSKLEEIMADHVLETSMLRGQLLHVLNDLTAAQDQLFSLETELASAKGLQFKAMTQAELMESAASMEKEKTEELLRHVSELKEDVLMGKLATNEAENVKCKILCEKDGEINGLKKELEVMEELESQLLARSIFGDYLELELNKSNELLSLSNKANYDAENDLKQVKADIVVKERENSDQAVRMEGLLMELSQVKLELKKANEEIDLLKCNIQMVSDELGKVKSEINEVEKRETEAQVEVAFLKSQLHKGRAKIAAAEAAEARIRSVKSGLYRAVQELAVEAEKAKMESRKLKHGEEDKVVEESEFDLFNPQVERKPFQDAEIPRANEAETETEQRRDEDDAHVTISCEEYESLVKKAEKADQNLVSSIQDSGKSELQNVKKELELTMAKIAEFRTRAEQAITRAEAAEKAKVTIEDQLRKWQEQRERRRAAFAALRQECEREEYSFGRYEERPATCQPLGKVLNMKF